MSASAHHEHEHGDPACDAAHGTAVLPEDTRRVVLVFDAPVAREIAALTGRLGWPVTLLDPDPARLRPGELPDVGTCTSVSEAGLDDRCEVVVCDHGRSELGDVLAEVLAGPSRWVGVMGSLRHTAPHVAALRARGVPEADIARVQRPIGLDIGSRTPPEIAIATVAGLLADRNGRPGGPFPVA
ncbi:MAG: XdhC family protein [Mycobacteriales bacterium]